MVDLALRREWARKDYAKDPERYRVYARKYYQLNKEGILEKAQKSHTKKLVGREYQHLIKMKVLMHYSNPVGTPICNNCGEMDTDVLCVDHINGGGLKHRKSIKYIFNNWLVNNNYPDGYQILCSNCNMKKSKLEY